MDINFKLILKFVQETKLCEFNYEFRILKMKDTSFTPKSFILQHFCVSIFAYIAVDVKRILCVLPSNLICINEICIS